jgi:hypothetical protein
MKTFENRKQTFKNLVFIGVTEHQKTTLEQLLKITGILIQKPN